MTTNTPAIPYFQDATIPDDSDQLSNENHSDAEFSLDDFLLESMQSKAKAKQISDSRKALAKGGVGPAERAELESLLHDWDMKREWIAAANVAVFDIQECSHCRSEASHFGGIYQRQSHRHSKIDRWVQSNPVQNQGLPKEIKCDVSYVQMCGNCVGELGWPVDVEGGE